MTDLKNMSSSISDEKYSRQFISLMNEKMSKLSKGGGMSGEVYKEIESDLGAMATSYYKKGGVAEKQMGDAIKTMQLNFKELLEGTNKGFSKELSGINAAYRDLQTIHNAAAARGAKTGVFTPEGLATASKSTDRTMRKQATSIGEGVFQTEAEMAERVLGSKIPDSGTPYRLMAAGGIGGLYDPAILGVTLGGAALYTSPAQKAIVSALTKRPDILRKAGKGVEELTPYLNPIAIGSSQQ